MGITAASGQIRLGPLAVRAGLVLLRPPKFSDAKEWSRLRVKDQAYLENWEPTAHGGWLTKNSSMASSAVHDHSRRSLSWADNSRQCDPRRTEFGMAWLLGHRGASKWRGCD